MKNITNKKKSEEIFFEDESFISELIKNLNEKEQKFFVNIAELYLSLMSGYDDLDYEKIAELIKGKHGLNSQLIKLKEEYICLKKK